MVKPDFTVYQICKKLISNNHKHIDAKGKSKLKGTRLFDGNSNPFVDLSLINFDQAYASFKKYQLNKNTNWLKLKKYYLKLQHAETQKKIKERVKVTFNDSPEIRKVGEERAKVGSSMARVGITTNDSSKADSVSHSNVKYIADESKNLYNNFMIRNYKMQHEINSYARHYRIKQQLKIEYHKYLKENCADEQPIVIFDEDEEISRNGGGTQNQRSITQNSPIALQEVTKPALTQDKLYEMKYRVMKVRINEFCNAWDISDLDPNKFYSISLKSHPAAQSSKGGAQDGGDKQAYQRPTLID